ncbi:MAG: reverse transcriptase [Lewinellaceae bacterium]|nr:reverse transcriptase [Lewinellaceae bacterium]
MKRADHLTERIIEPDNLRLAFWKAGKGKRYAKAVLAYGRNLEANLLLLRNQISTGLVEVGDYRFFKVFEPKERNICASAFREQVLHHALMNICHDHFERVQIFDSYASRRGKGTYAALARAQEFTAKYPWFLKLDVRKFFETIQHSVLKNQLRRMFKDQRLLEIFEKIIDSFEAHPGRGVPIGNLTSQYFANHYLAGLDHFIKERLRFKAYARYMDDKLLWHHDKWKLKEAYGIIRDYVQEQLRCELKPEILNRTRYGVPFLGYRMLPDHTRLLQGSKRRFIRKFQKIEEKYHSGEWSEAACQRHILPLLAFIRHADTKTFRENVILGSRVQLS